MLKTGTGFLVDPTGHEPTALDEEDYKRIRQYLHVRHSANDETCEAIDWLLHLSIEYDSNKHNGMDDHQIFTWMVRHYLSDGERDSCSRGVLAKRMGEQRIDVLTERELEVLQSTLTAIRQKHWFGEWLALQVCTIAEGFIPGDRFPSPLQIAATLTECIREHEVQMEAAREVVRMRPDLLPLPIYPIRAEPQATPEPPAAPEVAQPTRKGTPRARIEPTPEVRKSKPRKKASRAA